jgi:WD40 repeat protein
MGMLGILTSARAAQWIGLFLALSHSASSAAAQGNPQVEVVAQIGHSNNLGSAALSQDGRNVLSGDNGGTIKLWESATGRLMRTLLGHSGPVQAVAFSPDGRSAVSGSFDRTVKLWELSTGRLVHTFQGHAGMVVHVAFSPDGGSVVSGSSDKTFKLWNLSTGLVRTFEGHFGSVWDVEFSADGQTALSSAPADKVRLWDIATGGLLRTLEEPSILGVGAVAFSGDGRTALGWESGGHKIFLWNLASGKLERTLTGHSELVNGARFSRDGRGALSLSSDNTLRIWDVATGQLVRSMSMNWSLERSALLSSDGRFAVLCDRNGMELWDIRTERLPSVFEGHSAFVNKVAFSPDGRQVVSANNDETLKLWDLTSGRLLRTFEGNAGPPDLLAVSATHSITLSVEALAFSPNANRVLSSGRQRQIRIWDVATGQLARTFKVDGFAVAFSHDALRALSANEDSVKQDSFKLWDLGTGRLMGTLEGHSSWVRSAAFSPDDRRVVISSYDNPARLWDVATAKLSRSFESSGAAVAFSPDGGKILLSDSGFTLKLWHASTGSLLRTFGGHSDTVSSAAFSSDGRRALSGSFDKTVRLWDANTAHLIHTFEGHQSAVRSIALSPDGRRVVSGSADGTVRQWSLATGHEDVRLLASPNGDWLAQTPAGFFGFKGDLDRFVHLVRGMEVSSIGQVHQSLFNPDLVREALAGDPIGEVREAAKVINLEKVLDSGPAPFVAILSPTDGSHSATDLATVTVRIEDRGKGVGRIEWRVNGITAAVAAAPPGGALTDPLTQELALDLGDNTVEVLAYNGSNLLASPPARIHVKFDGPADTVKPKLHVLAIGIDKYVDKPWTERGHIRPAFKPLTLAVKDAMSFGSEIKRAAGSLYQDVIVTPVLDNKATRANVDREVRRIAKDVHRRDTFILFAAAHGASERGRFYLIPQDYAGGPGALESQAISQDHLQDWLANHVRARKALILLDTCESGAVVAGYLRSRTQEAASEAGVGRLHEATGRPVLTAAANGQFALEGLITASGERQGLFTRAILDALRKGDTNANGTIELSELVAYVQDTVPKLAAQQGGEARAEAATPQRAGQIPRFGSRGEDFVIANRLR